MVNSLAAALLIASPVPVADGHIVEPPAPVREYPVVSQELAVSSGAQADMAAAPSGATGDLQDRPAQVPASEPGDEGGDTPQPSRTVSAVEEPNKDFMGIKFGVGVAFTLDWGGQSRVKDAELVNNIVRVTESQDGEARVLLEVHHFWPIGGATREEALYGFGPFVSEGGWDWHSGHIDDVFRLAQGEVATGFFFSSMSMMVMVVMMHSVTVSFM